MLVPFVEQGKPRVPGRLRGKIRVSADFDEWPDNIASAFGVPQA
jgi:hypothetical protein